MVPTPIAGRPALSADRTQRSPDRRPPRRPQRSASRRSAGVRGVAPREQAVRISVITAALVLVGLVLAACDRGPDLDDIRRLQSRERYAATLEPLRAMLEDRPDDPELNYLYGVALNRTQSGRLSVWALRKAAADPAWESAARLELTSAAVASGNWQEAIEEASRILASAPDDETALTMRGTAYLTEGKQVDLALEDFERLLDLNPGNVSALASRAQALLLLGEVEEAEAAVAELQAATSGQEQPGLEATMCTTSAVLAAEKREPDATERFEACLEAFPDTPIVVEQAIGYFDGIGERDRATALLASLHEAIPGSQGYRQALAARAVEDGDEARAEAILRSGTTRPDPRTRSTAWIDLTNFYLARDDLDAAIEAYEQALALTPNPSQAGILQHADLLARAERHAEALEVAKGLEQDAYRGLIEARVHLNEHRPAEALKRLEAVFPTWPNNAGARYYAARAAEQLGDFERAIEEYRQSIRSAPEQTDAGLRLAKLYLEAGALQNAWGTAAHHFRAHPEDPEAVRVLLRAASAAEPESVKQLLTRLRNTRLWPTALAIRAQRIEDTQGPAPALASLEEVEDSVDLTRPANAELLRMRIRLLLAVGRVADARSEVDAALAAAPEVAAFHEVHGLVLEAEGAPAADVHAAYARAIELDENAWLALESLGRRAQAEGDLDRAVALFERAAKAAPERTSPREAAARALLAAGRVAEAEAVWEEQLREHPWDTAAAQALARLRLDRGQADDRALELAERAVLFRGGDAARDLLLEVHRKRGETARAEQLAQAIEAGRPLPPSRITPIDGL
jgi:tetratricopeptide (TPR) repeat protein